MSTIAFSVADGDALPCPVPSGNGAPADIHVGHSVANRTVRDVCDVCGAMDWTEGHYSAGKVMCPACWSGREPPVAMPPNAREQMQIADWISPQLATKGTSP